MAVYINVAQPVARSYALLCKLLHPQRRDESSNELPGECVLGRTPDGLILAALAELGCIRLGLSYHNSIDQARVLTRDTIWCILTSMELYPYQRTAVEFAKSTRGRVILADDMGLGKQLRP